MNIARTLLSVVGALVLLAPMAMAEAKPETLGQAVEVAGQQRMLSQRIVASYLLKAINPDSTSGKTRLKRAIKQFESNQQKLLSFKPGKPAIKHLQTVVQLWAPFKAKAQAKPSQFVARELLDASAPLLTAAHAYVVALESLSYEHATMSKASAEVINISGRQRMLSQRMAKNYLAYHWKVGDQSNITKLYEDLAEYESVLSYLQQSDQNTPSIVAKLNKVKGHLTYASKGFDGLMNLSGTRLVHVITGTTDVMLKNMDDVTKEYAVIMDQQPLNRKILSER